MLSPYIPDGSKEVPLAQVEQEVAQQMKALQDPGESPIYSARMSNLVIFCDQRTQAGSLVNQIFDVLSFHPARVLLVVGETTDEAVSITASVMVRRLQTRTKLNVCSELVTLHAAGATVGRLPFAVRALLVGDLPLNLWWASNQPPPLAGAFLFDLADNAQQIIYDSLGWVDPTRAVAATASWLQKIGQGLRGGRWRVASDLNWRRLKYWRRLITQTMESSAAPRAIETATELLVEHGPHAVIQAWQAVSWLTRLLDWKVQAGKVAPGVEIAWQFQAPHGAVTVRIRRLPDGPAELRRLRLQCQLGGKPGALRLDSLDAAHLEVVLEGVEAAPRTVTVQAQSLADLVGRQLSDRERDPIFMEGMAVAQTLAQSLLK
jgi:glucose-6-phosphate dehydrogenase assembly protein OpcA